MQWYLHSSLNILQYSGTFIPIHMYEHFVVELTTKTMFIHSLIYVEILRTCDSANGNFHNALKHVVNSYNNFLKVAHVVNLKLASHLKNKTFCSYESCRKSLRTKRRKKHSNDVTQRSICLIYSIYLKLN